MKKYRIIFHVDLNAFFASCEAAEDPSLKDKPIGIGPSSDRGILTTANYEARRYGVTSAMPVNEARKRCPHLRVLPVNFDLYERYSQIFFDYLSTYTERLEPASIDEGYLEMSESIGDEHPVDVAKRMQNDLHKQHRLPVSIGIAPNMFLAKMASDMKKPLGITVLRKRDVEEKLWPLPIEALHGIGKKTVPNLKLMGIKTIGDLATFEDKEKLRAFLGNQTDSFLQKVHGEDARQLDPERKEKHKSIGNSKTFDGFLHEYHEMVQALERLTARVSERLKGHDLAASTLTVQVRYSDFENRSRQITLAQPTDHFYTLFEDVERLFDELFEDRPVHLLGVSTSNLTPRARWFKQLSIFEDTRKRRDEETLDKVLESINAHYTKPLLKKGMDGD